MTDDGDCCCGGRCGPADRPARESGVSRRRFLEFGVGGVTAALLASRASAAHALGTSEDDLVLVPADKALDQQWVASLTERGTPTVYAGETAGYLGMPVGGGCAGQIYLGGDGRLWRWDVYNSRSRSTSDVSYAHPPEPDHPFGQGFALRTRARGRTSVRRLDGSGFPDVRFVGRYPMGVVDYRDADSPVSVRLEAFSPFVPLAVDDSTLPATVLAFTLRNASHSTVDVDMLGWSENAVCLDARNQQPITLTTAQLARDGAAGVQFGATAGTGSQPRPDVVLETWEKTTYEGWTVEGDAFGSGPVLADDVPDYMKRFGDLHVEGQRFVTSHRFEDGDTGKADSHTGSLTSRPFTIQRRYVQALVGGGAFDDTSVQLLVDGNAVATFTGDDTEPLHWQSWDVSRWDGRQAIVRIVDGQTGAWGHVNVDTIRQSDTPIDPRPMAELPDHGTFALAALDHHAVVRPSIAKWSTPEDLFTSADGPATADGGSGTLAGTVTSSVRLRPGQSSTVRFTIAWYFPVPDRAYLSFLRGSSGLLRRYATRFDSAAAVVGYLARDLDRLERATRLWTDTWYESSSLPWWLLERVMATAATIATSTCYQFQDGRFYGWEGVYCCAGTCEHVWNYAQSVARLFPALERDTRERVDLGIGFHADTGQMGFRAEADMSWAADGQCGTVLRIYREHQTSTDDAFLKRNWPNIKKAVRYLIGQDAHTDGTLEGPQPNTLDSVWYGEIAWITGMYVAALYAAGEMADEVGDAAFASTCRKVGDSGKAFVESTLWTGEYFIQRIDPAHANVINSNKGCHIDQMFGQSLADQLALPRVFAEDKARTALANLYTYNFTPDPARYREEHPEIQGGRWFAMADEPALLMTTWPHGGEDTAAGDPPSWAAIYFNECWTGQEYQAATQMLYEGLVEEGLTVTRAVHDRYVSGKRNPYNEIECGEHYARAMAGYGVYLGACGFTYHGPKGHIGFAPRLTPDDFRAAFTAAEGWGLYRQRRNRGGQESALEVRYGTVSLSSVSLQLGARPSHVVVRLGATTVPTDWAYDAGTLTVTLRRRTDVRAGRTLLVSAHA